MRIKLGKIEEAHTKISSHNLNRASNADDKRLKKHDDLMRLTEFILHFKVLKSADISILRELYTAITL